MSVGLDVKRASTIYAVVNEYGTLHRIHGASDPVDVPAVQDVKVVGDEVFFALGDSTLDVSAIEVEGKLVVDISIPGVDNSQLYRITMKPEDEASANYDHTSSGSASEDNILAGLLAAVNGVGGFSAVVRNDGGNKFLRIWRDGDLQTFTVALSAGGTGSMSQVTTVSRGDGVFFGNVISRRALQRDLQGAASAAGLALSHLGMRCRPGKNAVVWISFVHEVALGNEMVSGRRLTGV